MDKENTTILGSEIVKGRFMVERMVGGVTSVVAFELTNDAAMVLMNMVPPLMEAGMATGAEIKNAQIMPFKGRVSGEIDVPKH